MQVERNRKCSVGRRVGRCIGVIAPVLSLAVACGGDPLNTSNSTGSSLAPGIITSPANTTVTLGQPATFVVAASGSAPLAYQWLRGAVEIQGATQSTYTLPAATAADSGAALAVRVSNAFGTVTSASATLTVQ